MTMPHHCYLVRFTERAKVKYYRGQTIDLLRRKKEHETGAHPWEGPNFNGMRSITEYDTLAEAMAWERRVGNMEHDDKICLWNAGVDA